MFLTSDTHFCHRTILAHHPERGESLEGMTEAMVEAWNAVVSPSDLVWHLGDVAVANSSQTDELTRILRRLNGHVHLVPGNHDHKPVMRAVAAAGWEVHEPLVTIKADGLKAIACHFPILSWKGKHQGTPHAHGHSHGSLEFASGRMYDVGWDVWEAPLHWGQFHALVELIPDAPVDHHRERA